MKETDTIPVYVLCASDSLCKSVPSLKMRKHNVHESIRNANLNKKPVDIPIVWKDHIRKSHKELKKGELGNLLSHQKALKRFVSSGYPNALILEDDANVKPFFFKELSRILKALKQKKQEWDIIWIHNSGAAEYKGKKRIPIRWKYQKPVYKDEKIRLFRLTRDFIGSTTCYLLKKKVAKRFLQNYLPLRLPTDVFMQSNIPKDEIHLSFPPARITSKAHKSYLVTADEYDSLIV